MTKKLNEPSKNEITSAAQLIGRRGGLKKSAKKKLAVKNNGKLGGRPKGMG